MPPTTGNVFSYTTFDGDFRRNVTVNHVAEAKLPHPEITTYNRMI